MFRRTPLFLIPVVFVLKHTNESNDHPLLLLRAGCSQMRDLRKHRISLGQLRIKYLVGGKTEAAQEQLQLVHARSLFAQLDRGDLSVTDCTFFRKLLPGQSLRLAVFPQDLADPLGNRLM